MAVTRFPLANSSRPSVSLTVPAVVMPPISSRAVRKMPPKAEMSATTSSSTSLIEPCVAVTVTVLEMDVMLPILMSPFSAVTAADPAEVTWVARRLPLVVRSSTSSPRLPPAWTEMAVSGPPAVTRISPSRVERLCRAIPSFSEMAISPAAVNDALSESTSVLRSIPVSAETFSAEVVTT